MTLDDKITRAKEVVNKVVPLYHSPIVMSSFGKDSMVLLEIVKQTGRKLPVLHHADPFFPKKNAFAREVAIDENYVVYDYPPTAITMIKGENGVTELVRWFSVGPGKKMLYLPMNLDEPERGKPFLCGLRDVYRRPTVPSFNFPWDLALNGHKNSDRDQLFGDVPLNVDLHKNESGPDYLYPLRHFTDEDILQFHHTQGVRFQTTRYYDNHGKFADLPDHTYNNDYQSVCVRCMDRSQPDSVLCPLINEQVTNISADIMYTKPDRPKYIGE